MAAAFAIKSTGSDFVWEKDVEERVVSWGVGEAASDAETETGFVAAEIGDFDDEVSVWWRDCDELVEFVIYLPITVDLYPQGSVAYFPDGILADSIPCVWVFGVEVVVPSFGSCGDGAADSDVEEYESVQDFVWHSRIYFIRFYGKIRCG